MEKKDSIQIRCMPVNPIQMNLYVVYEKNGEGIIIDPGCSENFEFEKLFDFIRQENINIRHILLTHPHFDHLMGCARICKEYNLPLELHRKALPMLDGAVKSVTAWGMPPIEAPEKTLCFDNKDKISFGGHQLEVRYSPGHCEGSVCFVLHENKTVFTGDVLFNGSIGRTDFPTGDLDLLKESIFTQLFTLDEDFQVRPGHGGRTSIEHEKYNNPFLY